MQFVPQVIEPGYQLRWLRVAFALMQQTLPLWLLMSTVVTVGCWLADDWLIALLPLGVFANALAIELASRCADGFPGLAGMSKAIAVATAGAIRELWRQRARVVICTGMLLGIHLLYLSVASASVLEQGAVVRSDHAASTLTAWLRSDGPFHGVAMAMFLAHLLQDDVQAFGFLRYPLWRVYRCADEASEQLVAAAYQRNQSVGRELSLGTMAVLLVVLTMAPVLAVVLVAVLPAMQYAACRELFDSARTRIQG